MMANIHFVA